MNILLVCSTALALAMDAFAVSIGISLGGKRLFKKQILRLASHFGFFQFMMAFIGLQGAHSVLIKHIEGIDHWVAFGLLFAVGLKMIYASFGRQDGAEQYRPDLTRGMPLLLLSIATSIDALAVGLGLAALQAAILYPAVVIGLVAFVMTVIGARMGPIFGRVMGKGAEIGGGLVLLLIGIKILLGHL